MEKLNVKIRRVLDLGSAVLRSNTSDATREVKTVSEFMDFLEKERSISFDMFYDKTYDVLLNDKYVEWTVLDSAGEVIEFNVFEV